MTADVSSEVLAEVVFAWLESACGSMPRRERDARIRGALKILQRRAGAPVPLTEPKRPSDAARALVVMNDVLPRLIR